MSKSFGGSISGAAIEDKDTSTNNQKGSRRPSLAATSKTTVTRKANNVSQQSTSLGQVKRNLKHTHIEDSRINELVKARLKPKYCFGSNPTKADCLQSFTASTAEKENSDRLLYKVGTHICVFDPDTTQQSFFSGRLKNVVAVTHFTISNNHKYISMCESLKVDRDQPVEFAQLSIYNLQTMSRLKTLTVPGQMDFISSVFCGDPRFLAALSDTPEKQLHLWQWDKEKSHKCVVLPSNASVLRSPLTTTQLLSFSGPGYLKLWHVSPDNSLKSVSFLNPLKESESNFVDHAWLKCTGSTYALAVLATHESEHAPMRQTLTIFEGVETAPAGSSALPLAGPCIERLEHRQTLNLRLEGSGFSVCVVESIAPTSKGFVLVGSNGYISIIERTDEKRDPYLEKRISIVSVSELPFLSATLLPSEEKLVTITKHGRILSLSLDSSSFGNGMDTSMALHFDDEHQDLNGTRASNQKDLLGLPSPPPNPVSDLMKRGFHSESIISADLSFDRPLIATISTDQTLRIWNYETCRCELVHTFSSEEPYSVAIHYSGFQLLVSFKDRVRSYNILMDRMKPFRETVQKMCKELKYSHGGQYWAAASTINVVVYDTKSFQQLMSFQGHMMSIRRLVWAPGDQVIFSAGMDGNVYGWPISQEGRVDVIAANNRASSIQSLEVDCTSMVFLKAVSEEESGAKGPAPEVTRNLIVSSYDGSMKIIPWAFNSDIRLKGGIEESMQVLPGNPHYPVGITFMTMAPDRKRLFAGTSIGTVRIYAWPPQLASNLHPGTAALSSSGGGGGGGPSSDSTEVVPSGTTSTDKDLLDTAVFFEVAAHSTMVISLKISPMGNTLVSVGEDGSIFIHSLTIDVPPPAADAKPSLLDMDLGAPDLDFNADVLMLSHEDIEDHVHEVMDLQKVLNETRAKADFQSHQSAATHAEELKKIMERHESQLIDEKGKNENLRQESDKRVRELLSAIETKELDHVKMSQEMENRYEHKLADQLDRYDKLAEEMTLLKQKCEGLLRVERAEFTRQLNELRNEARYKEKRMKTENKRINDDRLADENAFKEILGQQEDEYEDELRQLINSAEAELLSERETVEKLTALVRTKNSKLDQVKKKLTELNLVAKHRLAQVTTEKQEKQKLQETIEHYRKNLVEREAALAEKEKTILELRSTTRTLENFRFVLDHRLQQLSAERGPITTHIEGLEKHISRMYEELVEEFDLKKTQSDLSDQKDQKISMQNKELAKLRADVAFRDRQIAGFKRELESIVASTQTGKDLEDSVLLLYKKYIRGENVGDLLATPTEGNNLVSKKVKELMKGSEEDLEGTMRSREAGRGAGMSGAGTSQPNPGFVKEVESALIQTAKEADRQRNFKEREAKNLQYRLRVIKEEATRDTKHRLFDNTNLLYECNDRRREGRELERTLEITRNELKDAQNTISRLRKSQERLKDSQSVGGRGSTVSSNVGTNLSSSDTPFDDTSPPSPTSNNQAKSSSLLIQNSLGKSASAHQIGGPQGGGGKAQAIRSSVGFGKALFDGGREKDRVVQRMAEEVEDLTRQLDEAHREREMQRTELLRVRKELMRVSMLAQGGGSVRPAPGFFQGSSPSLKPAQSSLQHPPHYFVGEAVGFGGLAPMGGTGTASYPYPNPYPYPSSAGLSNADLYGVPSESDLLSFALLPSPSQSSPNQFSKSLPAALSFSQSQPDLQPSSSSGDLQHSRQQGSLRPSRQTVISRGQSQGISSRSTFSAHKGDLNDEEK